MPVIGWKSAGLYGGSLPESGGESGNVPKIDHFDWIQYEKYISCTQITVNRPFLPWLFCAVDVAAPCDAVVVISADVVVTAAIAVTANVIEDVFPLLFDVLIDGKCTNDSN